VDGCSLGAESPIKTELALVCGAASGIGTAVVQRFIDEGAVVLVCGLPSPPFEGSLFCGVTDDAQVRASVDELLNRHGRIDVLVNSSGVISN